MECSKERALVIGYGNPLRGDDGVGWFIVTGLESLLKRAISEGVVELVSAHQLTPELAETASKFSLVVFVDACCDRDAGVVCRKQVEAAHVESTEGMTHQLDTATLLGYTKLLYGLELMPDALLYTIGGQSFEFGESISRSVKRAAEFVVQDIADIIMHECFRTEDAPVLT